ncbi:hypothetical protein [Hymenobacter rubripertinctus]|uniref:SGNH/GDSL hydrolase family protein n=1 Tax=Hymenobacter rubripertinctus TaxID=2029981 RepID=A0A418R8V4_9BACT|nr:hypothetical protein [Hymenobacter rubripertinctus]RIY13724.1 hypothetical protein D0T11_01185 [Hymenobacter rubripertinctus]
MKKFGFFFLLFSTLLLALDQGGAWVLDRLHERVVLGQRDGLLITYLRLPDLPQLVVLGNSRTAVNVCPDSLPGAFSLAHNGTTQVFQTGLLSVLHQQQRLPPAILLHIDLDEYIRPTRAEDIHLLKYYYGQAPLVTAYSREASWLEPLKQCFGLYRHNGRIPGLLRNWYMQRRHPDQPLNQGYEPSVPAAADSLRTAYSLAKLNAESGQLNRGHLRYLQDFVQLCQQQNVRLICFTNSYYQQPHHVAAAGRLVDSLLQRAQVPYLNYASQPIAELSHNIGYWRDATHLNTRGIPLNSQVLARQVSDLLPPTGLRAEIPTLDDIAKP